jgi:hypothetical protein
MAGRKPKLTQEQVVDALKQAHGLKSVAAGILDVAYNTIDRYVAKSARAQEVIDFWRIKRTERAMFKLDEAIERGDAWAIALQLKDNRDGRERGYGTALDVTSGGEKLSNEDVIYDRLLAKIQKRMADDEAAGPESASDIPE